VGGFVLGVIATAVLMASLGAGPQEPQNYNGRYLISSWGDTQSHGAYRIDSQTGIVLEIVGNRSGNID
jgi:hypothetical protein